MNINELANRYEDFKKSLVKHSELQITDNSKIVVDGCHGVLEYDENFIKLEMSSYTVKIVGLELKLRNFSLGGIIVCGKIHSVTFGDKEGQ